MPTGAVGGLIGRGHQIGIISLDELRECWDELGTQNPPDEDVVRVAQRKGYLTPFQIDKLKKGDKDGYFYGGNKVLYKIASGSFARVYRARSGQTGETVALKVLRQRWTSDKASVEAFYHEGKVGMMLRHPNIVRVDEVAGHDNHHYIAMEFVEGGNLRDFLIIRQRLSRDECLRLMLDMLRGLAHAFEQGVTHRDLKMTNVLISSHGEAKLVDFGLATLHKDERAAEDAHGQRTVEYGILERMSDSPKGDPRSDVFFMGAIFYQMLTGRPPIPEKKDRASRLLRTRLDNIRPVREADPSADPQLAAVIDRMMSLSLGARYQTPQEVIAVLEGIRFPTGTGSPRPDSPAPATTNPATKAPPAAPAPAASARSIMFIESNTKLQDTVRDKLHTLGFRVLITADPSRAVERFKEQPLDGVIVDCETTGRAGFNAAAEMLDRAAAQKQPLAAILLLSPEQSEWSGRLAQHPRVRSLIRPVTLRQLREHVEGLLGSGKAAS